MLNTKALRILFLAIIQYTENYQTLKTFTYFLKRVIRANGKIA